METRTMYRLDFRRGVVEEIDERTPPRGMAPSPGDTEPEPLPQGRGYVFAVLGAPPSDEEER
jgi:hypothetical protein